MPIQNSAMTQPPSRTTRPNRLGCGRGNRMVWLFWESDGSLGAESGVGLGTWGLSSGTAGPNVLTMMSALHVFPPIPMPFKHIFQDFRGSPRVVNQLSGQRVNIGPIPAHSGVLLTRP